MHSTGATHLPEVQGRNAHDELSLADLIRKKRIGVKAVKGATDRDGSGDEGDEVVGDTNFDTGAVSGDYFNTFAGFDDDELRAEGFETTNQYQKAEFNEPAPRRFGTRTKKATQRWTIDETDLFYHILSMCGTDFSMMSKFIKGRTRKMIVNKFHCEEERNGERVAQALRAPVPLDLSLYATTVGIDEGSIVADYKRNKEKLLPQVDIPARAPPRLRKPTEEEDVVEWENVASDKEDGGTDNEQSAGGDDEIHGDLEF